MKFPPEQLAALAGEVAALLRERTESASVAETAAGGLIPAALLSIDGASKIYKGRLCDQIGCTWFFALAGRLERNRRFNGMSLWILFAL